jgi:hypothetical protein
LVGALTAAVVIGVGLAALATWSTSGAVFEHAGPAGDVDVVKAALPAMVGAVIAVVLVVVYRRQKDSERAQFAQPFGAAWPRYLVEQESGPRSHPAAEEQDDGQDG